MKYFKIEEEREKYYSKKIIIQNTNKGFESLFFNKFKYSLKVVDTIGKKKYRCTEKRCTATLVLTDGSVVQGKQHNHVEIVIGLFLKYYVMSNMHVLALQSFLTTKEIITRIKMDLDASERQELANYSSLVKKINKLRKENSVSVPKEDEEIPLEYYKTIDNFKFIHHYMHKRQLR
ncbi:hypothetical protein DMUE_3579 [Dictyocoela muelleri]|nr:hypothetical protein DMUE_3579 [Dictyocoela muelleri]